jgi:acyl-CoA thioesterase I
MMSSRGCHEFRAARNIAFGRTCGFAVAITRCERAIRSLSKIARLADHHNRNAVEPKTKNARQCCFALLLFACMSFLCLAGARNGDAAGVLNIVALGASNTSGWGVGSENAYPARLEALLRAKGYDAHVTNAGRSFDTTGGMLRRMDSAVPAGTSIVVLNPGGNDLRFFGTKEQREANIAEIVNRLHARHIKVIVFENSVVPANLYQWDGIHFNAEGHKGLAAYLLPQVIAASQVHATTSNRATNSARAAE